MSGLHTSGASALEDEPQGEAGPGGEAPAAAGPPPAPTALLAPPLGELLVREGLVPREAVEQAIELQAAESQRGVFLRLGELLVARGLLSEEAVARVLALQGQRILVCPHCLSQYNVVHHDPGQRYPCARCGATLELPERVARLSVEDTLRLGDPGERHSRPGEPVQRRFAGYQILGEISRGGMGVIYKAYQASLERVIAMKVISPRAPEWAVARFRDEARAVARLRHPGIVAIHEVGRVGEVDYFTMDFIEGLTLQQAVTSEGLSLREVAEVFVKICDAVEYSHDQGILHRDLKPSNILLDRRHNPVLVDFGIAKAIDQVEDPSELVGSPAYLPPEYVAGERPYDHRGEVYGLGASLYTVLAGRPPHSGVTTAHVLARARKGEITPLRRLRPGIDRDLETIVDLALSPDPDARYPNVHELGNDLRRWLEGEELAGNKSPLGRTWSRIRGRVAASLGLVISILLLLISVLSSLRIAGLEAELREVQQQLEGERRSGGERLQGARVALARLQVELARWDEAEQLLTELLADPAAGHPLRGELLELRARAREARGDHEGAAADRLQAER